MPVSRVASRLAVALAVGAAVTAASAGVAHADAAYQYVKPYRAYAAQNPFSNEVRAVFTSMQPALKPMKPTSGTMGIASYGSTDLGSTATGLASAQTASQLFSDRLYPDGSPFADTQADTTGLEIDLNNKTQTVTLFLDLDTYGTTEQLSNPRVEDGMLLADGPGAGTGAPTALFTIALNEISVPG
jgi:hypothetical protein